LTVEDAYSISMNLTNPGFGADAETIKAIREPMMKHLDHRFAGDRQS
jgi:hypothetical protein